MNQAYDQSQSNVVGKFRLIAELGRGGMSEVYLAVVAGPAGFNKLTVVKLIKAELAEDPEFISMFLEEARLSARLNHPNVVQTNEVGQHGSRYYIAMEYLEGQPYSRIVNRMGRDRGLPLGMNLRILSDVLAGLQYAHELRDFNGSALEVVHRDVTPHNIFVTYDGGVKVVDFGIAKAMNSSHETRTGMLKGKVGYMAPEQARGERVDRRADVFSVGVMLWEAAVGRRMWKGYSEVQVLHQLMAGEIPRPRAMRADISENLEAIIMKSLALDRRERFASALEFQGALDELLDAGTERTTLREVGRRVASAFDDERQKIKQIIEGQLAQQSQMQTGMYAHAQLPVFDPQRFTGEYANMRTEDGQRGSFTPNSGQLPSFGGYSGSSPGTPHSLTGPHPLPDRSGAYPMPRASAPTNDPSSYSHPSTGSIAHSSVSTANQPMPPSSSSTKLTLVALGIAVVASALIAVLYMSFGQKPPAAAQTSTGDAAKTAAATAAPTSTSTSAAKAADTGTATAVAAPAMIDVKIDVRPKDATVFLDDKKLAGKETQIPKDGAKHQLRIEASGYGSRTRDFDATSDLTWDLDLSPSAGGHPAQQTQTQPQGHDDPGKMTVSPTARPIDTGYPGGG